MQKNIIHDQHFLSQKSAPATRADLPTALDLVDTLTANADRAVGLAANMIGVQKQIIAVSIGVMNIAMLNPKLTKKATLTKLRKAVFHYPANGRPPVIKKLKFNTKI